MRTNWDEGLAVVWLLALGVILMGLIVVLVVVDQVNVQVVVVPPTVSQPSRASTSVVKCFGCGKTGHHQVDCKKYGRKSYL